MVRARHRKKYFVLPTTLLAFNLLHEVVVYESARIGDPDLQTAFLMAMFLCGFALVSWVVAPLVERTIDKVFLTGKRGAGIIGELAVAAVFFTALFLLYKVVYTTDQGIAAILPAAWRTP